MHRVDQNLMQAALWQTSEHKTAKEKSYVEEQGRTQWVGQVCLGIPKFPAHPVKKSYLPNFQPKPIRTPPSPPIAQLFGSLSTLRDSRHLVRRLATTLDAGPSGGACSGVPPRRR